MLRSNQSSRLATAGLFKPSFHSGPSVPSRFWRLSSNVRHHKGSMRAHALLPTVVVVLAVAASAQSDVTEAQTRFALRAAVEALDFRQGDLASLVDAKLLFTESGWAAFSRKLNGFVDHHGAATFTSTFTPSGPATSSKRVNDSLTVTIPGVLRHESRHPQGGMSTTSYRAEIDVRISTSPFKVELLLQRTCGGASTVQSCQ